MQCPQCQSENLPDSIFCSHCGTKLERVCSHCQTGNLLTSNFCRKCGTSLTEQPPNLRTPDAGPRTPDSSSSEAERRQLTVMFCDLVGSTPLAEKLDPEDLREVILAYQQTCAEAIRRFDGYLARYVGDGLLVYFGYPQAHEDDAQRAVRAGLEIVAALPELNTRLQQTVKVLGNFPLQVRIGIHTGLVVVGDMGGGGYRDPSAIVGETPNIAARVQGIAEPNTVMISAATYRLVQGLFECHDRGPQALKGVSTPVPVYRVLGESETQSRFEAAVSKGLTPLVGREEELGLLRRRWEQAKAGEGQVVLLSGEPGIGKSRLVQALKEQASAEGATRIEFRCSAYHQNSAFYPLIEHLRRLLQFVPHDTPQAKVTKLTQRLASYRFPQADTLPLLAALLSMPHPEEVPPLTLNPQKQKQKTQEALVAWIIEETERAPVFCAWEDLHWADPSTLEVITLFLDQVPTRRLLALLTSRPEFTPPWRSRSHITRLTLTHLGRSQVEVMVEKVTGGKPLPTEILQQIVRKTDGVPLFVEELTKMVLESGLVRAVNEHYELSRPLPPLAIPSTLQDSLMARLDHLALVKEIAQLGATLGREFSYEVLHAVCPLDAGVLQQGLRQLVEVELLYQRGLPPQATYLFKHALIQDAAYQSLLKSKRQQYHNKIAQVLEEQLTEIKETQPELLAHHYTEAGLIEQAIPYWQRAGERASQRSAYVEAAAHLTRGLEVLQALPDTPMRAQQELVLQAALGATLMVTKGYAAPEVGQAYARARQLYQQLGEIPQILPVLRRVWLFSYNRGQLPTARALAEQLLRPAQGVNDRDHLHRAHVALGLTLFSVGEFTAALMHLEQSLALYDPQLHRPDRSQFSTADTTVSSLCYAAWTLWQLGYPAQARKRMEEALSRARELAHPFSLAFALFGAARLSLYLRDVQAAQEWNEALLTLARAQGFPFWVAGTMIRQGWVLALRGQAEAGIQQIQQGIAAVRAAGTELWRPSSLALLAEAYGQAGQGEEGLTALAEALATVANTGERMSEAELYRLKGELTLQAKVQGLRSNAEEVCKVGSARQNASISEAGVVGGAHPTREVEAEECFWKAIEIARRQQAKSLELRAVTSLGRLWQQQGKKKEAHERLAEIYGWFTEGFDTKDLQEARALLEKLT